MGPRDLAYRAYLRLREWKFRNFNFPRRREDFTQMKAVFSDDMLYIGGWEVMREWERPLMQALAREVTRNGGHVLEVGFGMGISAGYVMEYGCSRYTVIEPHPAVLERARAWAKQQPVPVEIVEGFWQDVIDRLDVFDGILFDTFPLSKTEAGKNHYPFIPKARDHLKPGGIFTYFSDRSDTFEPEHMKLVLNNFREVRLYKITCIKPEQDSRLLHATAQPVTWLVPVCTR